MKVILYSHGNTVANGDSFEALWFSKSIRENIQDVLKPQTGKPAYFPFTMSVFAT